MSRPGQSAGADPNQVEQLGGLTILTPRDRGAMPYAQGTPVLNADGQPAAYVVASDDNIQMIATRFCLRPDWIASVNAVRRNAGQELYVGDTLNLDAHTIYSVGTQRRSPRQLDPRRLHPSTPAMTLTR